MTTISYSSLSASTTATLSLWINRGLESLWLLTVFLTPLAFLGQTYAVSEASIAYVEVPKIGLLRTLVALMAMLWLIEWGIQGRFSFEGLVRGGDSRFLPAFWLGRLKAWLGERPSRLMFLAAWFYLGTTLLSTILSGSFHVSLWGEVPGQDGYPAYTVVAYVLLFAVVATHLKTRAQMWRLIAAIVTMGTLIAGYAVLQHYGHDFLDLIEQTGGGESEVSVFMGNSLFAGATMMMVIPMTLAAAVLSVGELRWSPQWSRNGLNPLVLSLAVSGLWSAVFTVQLLGIYFTFARGPWGGVVAALAGFLLLVAIFAGWRALGRAVAILGLTLALLHGLDIIPLLGLGIWLSPIIALAGVFVLALVYMDRSVLGRVVLGVGLAVILGLGIARGSDLFTGPDRNASTPATQTASGELAERLSSIKTEVLSGFASGRATHWRVSWRLFRDRPWPEFDDLNLRWLRPLIGYGPDLFRYTYLLESPAEGNDQLPSEPDHAHNFFIHHLVVQGILGLFSSLGLFVAVFVAGGYVLLRGLLRERNGYSLVHKLLLVGLLATLAGRLVEMMFGVARVSDLTVLWVLLALFAALPQVMQGSEVVPESVPPQPPSRRTRRRAEGPTTQVQRFNWGFFGRLAVVAWLIGGIFVLTWVKTVNNVRAAVETGAAARSVRHGDFQAGLASLDRAIELAPDISSYYNYKGQVYSAYLRSNTVAPERECSAQETQNYRVCLAFQSYLTNLKSVEKRPFYHRSHLALANSAFTLASGSLALADEAVRLYEETLALVPVSWRIRIELADAYVKAGQPVAAQEALEESLAIAGDAGIPAKVSLIQGLAYRGLGELEKSVQSLEQYRKLEPLAAAQRGINEVLGELYFDLGKPELGADAFIRQGIAFEDLGQIEKVIPLLEQSAEVQESQGERESAAATLFLIGLAYFVTGQLDASAHALERNLQLLEGGPTARITHQALVEVYTKLGRPELALPHREQAQP